jgi:ribonuclease P protein component
LIVDRPSPAGVARASRAAATEAWRPADRLRRRPDYLRCYRRGRRFDAVGLSLYVARGEGAGPRFGITASRKVGKAVVRQRVRRRVREVLRRSPERGALSALDVVVHLHPAAARLSFPELRASLEGALARVHRSGSRRAGAGPVRTGGSSSGTARSGGAGSAGGGAR